MLRENGIEFLLKYFTELVVFLRDSFKSIYCPVSFLVLLYIKEVSLYLILICRVLRTLYLSYRYSVGMLRTAFFIGIAFASTVLVGVLQTVLFLVYLVRLSFRVLYNFYRLFIEGSFIFFISVGVTFS